MKEEVSTVEVSDFKNKWCNENRIIAEIIKNELQDYFIEPILDVGAGLGDIAFNSLKEKIVLCIDVNKICEEDFPLARNHRRIQIDFFDFIPREKVNTVFISHTLQFLDHDIEALHKMISKINPEVVVLILNQNNDILGDIIRWARFNCSDLNPEVKIPEFPKGYTLTHFSSFTANLSCNSFSELATQVSYLLLTQLTAKSKRMLIKFLKTKTSIPGFAFNQSIEIYKKNGTE